MCQARQSIAQNELGLRLSLVFVLGSCSGRLRQSLSSSRGQLEQLINGNKKQVKRMKLYLFRLRTNVSASKSYESNFSFLINRPTKGRY